MLGSAAAPGSAARLGSVAMGRSVARPGSASGSEAAPASAAGAASSAVPASAAGAGASSASRSAVRDGPPAGSGPSDVSATGGTSASGPAADAGTSGDGRDVGRRRGGAGGGLTSAGGGAVARVADSADGTPGPTATPAPVVRSAESGRAGSDPRLPAAAPIKASSSWNRSPPMPCRPGSIAAMRLAAAVSSSTRRPDATSGDAAQRLAECDAQRIDELVEEGAQVAARRLEVVEDPVVRPGRRRGRVHRGSRR